MNYRMLFSGLGAALILAACGGGEQFQAGDYRQDGMLYHFDRDGSGFRAVGNSAEQVFAWQVDSDRVVVSLPTSREKFRIIDKATIARQDDRYFNLEGHKPAASPRYPAMN